MKHILIILASIFLLPSCEHLGPFPNKKRPLISVEDPPGKDTEEVDLGQKSKTDQDEIEQKDEFYRGTGRFVGTTAKTGKAKASSASGKFTLNFEDAALSEVVKVILSDTLNESYMVNPKVVGKVTLQTSRPLTKQELLPTLELLLQVNNAALIKDTNMYRIEPLNLALKAGVSPSLARRGKAQSGGYQVQVMPLQYVGVEEIQEILKPMVSPTTIVRVDKSRNLLMVAGTAKELEGIKQTVATFDVDYMEGMSFGIFPLHNSDVETINKELEEIFDSGEGSPMSEMFRMIPLERLNAILAITPQPRYLDKIKLWISRLDKATSGASGGVIVYPVQHIKAVELADTLNEIFAGGGKKKTKDATVAPGRKAVKVSGKDKKKTRTATSRKSGTAQVSGIGDVKIIADEANNTIVIVATPQEYETIKTVIKQLDVMPLQVLLEATIIEVRLNDETKYGVSWGFGSKGVAGTTTTTDSDGNTTTTETSVDAASRGLAQLGTLAATAAGDGGFSYVLSNAANTVQATIDAFGQDENVNVLSTPSLMVLNNQEARIHVGDTVPIRTSEVTNLGSGLDPNTAVNSSIESQETGITLEITPRVNASGVVIMDINQEFDEISKAPRSSNIDSPTILNREIKSSVAIHTGETVILGGLITEQYDDNTTGIPWFKDLPYVGPLFGVTARAKVKTELVVLITPRVVQNKTDARKVTREYQLRLPGLYEIGDNLENISEELKQLNEHKDIPMNEYSETPVKEYKETLN